MRFNGLAGSFLVLTIASATFAQTSATGVISETGFSAGVYSYDIQLNNTGSTGIQTFWFSWVPGLNFMPDMPSAVNEPAGWVETITGNSLGYAIQWKTSGGLASNTSLDGFDFSSVDSLTVLEGNSQGNPILTSFVYSGQPLSGTSDQFIVAPAPEPASWLSLGGLALVGIAVRRRRAPLPRR